MPEDWDQILPSWGLSLQHRMPFRYGRWYVGGLFTTVKHIMPRSSALQSFSFCVPTDRVVCLGCEEDRSPTFEHAVLYVDLPRPTSVTLQTSGCASWDALTILCRGPDQKQKSAFVALDF